MIARAERTYEGSLPLVTFGALTAAIIAVFTIASGAIILIPTFLWSVDLVSYIDPLVYKTIWWGMGHSSQQINVSAHVAVWYAIAAMVFGAKPLSEKVSRMAFLMYILFLQLASAHHMLVEPGLSSEWKIFNTSYAMYLAVLGSMIHGMTVPGSISPGAGLKPASGSSALMRASVSPAPRDRSVSSASPPLRSTLAKPQSTTCTSPNKPIMMFAGLRSRCSTPRECA